MKTCTIGDCQRPLSSRGMCEMHRSRWREHGDPNVKLTLLRATPQEFFLAFWKKVQFGEGCWEWRGYRLPKGYGLWQRGYAHRYSYEQIVGPIPPGYFVCHHCDNPPCVRPSHLYAGSREENTRDAVERGRFLCGEEQQQAKLSDASVRVIRRLNGRLRQWEIGELLGVSQTLVSKVLLGKIWRHVA